MAHKEPEPVEVTAVDAERAEQARVEAALTETHPPSEKTRQPDKDDDA